MHPYPVIAIDIVLLTVFDAQLHVVMREGDRRPLINCMVLPGANLREPENLKVAADRLVAEEFGPMESELEQFGTFADPDRFPGGSWLVSVGFVGLVPFHYLEHSVGPMLEYQLMEIKCEDHDIDARLFYGGVQIDAAMDQAYMIARAVKQLRRHFDATMDIFKLVPKPFTILDLMEAYEAVKGEKQIKPLFRKRILERKFAGGSKIVPTQYQRRGGAHRPARLYALAPSE